MLLGVVSDTHGYMDPRVAPLLQGVEHILHAGDIGKGDIIGQLGLNRSGHCRAGQQRPRAPGVASP